MTEQTIFDKLVPLIREVTGVRANQIQMTSGLMQDLGAESVDLLDFSFLIEETFDITLEPDEFEQKASRSLQDTPYEANGILTDQALAELRKSLPEITPALLQPGLKKIELPSILNVAVFVHLIQRKLAGQCEETQHVNE
jgi:acyl carrier protein